MATALLAYMPVRDSYTLTPAYNIVEARLDGGKSRRRRDTIGGIHVITPTWILDKTQYTNFMAFFRERLQDGSRQFRCQLLSEQAFVMPHLVTLLGAMPKLTQQAGDAYFVSAVLEVTPNPCRSFSVMFQNAAGVFRVLDMGSPDFAGNIAEFPVGRDVVITGSRTTQPTWGGVTIDLDGTYEIDSHSSSFTFDLLDADLVNPDWTVLFSLTPTNTPEGVGACILVPE